MVSKVAGEDGHTRSWITIVKMSHCAKGNIATAIIDQYQLKGFAYFYHYLDHTLVEMWQGLLFIKDRRNARISGAYRRCIGNICCHKLIRIHEYLLPLL